VEGVSLRYVRGMRGKTFSQLSHSLTATLQALRARHDVVLVVNVANSPFLWPLKVFGIPGVINVDGLEWERPKWKGMGQRYFRWAARIAAKRATTLITDAEGMRDVYLDLFDSDSEMIPYGAPSGIIPNWAVLNDNGITRGEYFVVLGRLVPDNNGDLIAEEFVRSAVRQQLVVIGDVPYRDRFSQDMKDRFGDDGVRFTGYVTDPRSIQALLEGSRAYVHGHEFGGTNPSLLWAMGAGCRILALDTRFSREVLSDGECGGLFTKQPGALSEMLIRLDREPDYLAGQANAASIRATTAYSWEAVVERYEQVLLRACGAGVPQ